MSFEFQKQSNEDRVKDENLENFKKEYTLIYERLFLIARETLNNPNFDPNSLKDLDVLNDVKYKDLWISRPANVEPKYKTKQRFVSNSELAIYNPGSTPQSRKFNVKIADLFFDVGIFNQKGDRSFMGISLDSITDFVRKIQHIVDQEEVDLNIKLRWNIVLDLLKSKNPEIFYEKTN